MVKRLPLTDFRAVRLILEPDDFALGEEVPEPPPSDLIDKEVWDSLTTLPGDVAIKTSDHNGKRLSTLNTLSGIWIEAIGDPSKMDNLFGCMLDVNPYRLGFRDKLTAVYRKINAGADGFFTQPVFDLRLMAIWAEMLHGLNVYWGNCSRIKGTCASILKNDESGGLPL